MTHGGTCARVSVHGARFRSAGEDRLRMMATRVGRRVLGSAVVLVIVGCKSADGPAAAHVATVVIAPSSPGLFVGETVQLTAQLRDAAGNTLAARPVAWSSGNTLIATVSATGLVTALQEGTVIVRATSEGVDGQTSVTTRTPVASLVLSRTAVSMGVGSDYSFSVEARSAQGVLLSGRPVTWTTSAAAVAAVSVFGVVTARETGTATITATVESRVATATVTVGSAIASVAISPPTLSLGAGATASLVATARDAQGNALANRIQSWTSSNGGIATVSEIGTVSAVALGSADVTVRMEGISATVPVTVRPGDVAIQGAQLSQTVQDGSGTVPMLSGRAAVLTVLLSSRATQTVPVELVFRLLNATNTVVYSDTLRSVLNTAPNPTLQTSTAQFLIPAAQLRAGVRWQVERDPRRLAPDDTLSNDLFPRAAPSPVTVVTAPPLLLRFVPIQLTAHGNATGNVTTANMESYLYMVRRLLPLSEINATVGPIFTTNANFGTAPSGGAEAFWTTVLQELDLARLAGGDAPGTHWYGIMVPPSGFNFTVYGGFGYIPFSGTSTSAGTRTALSVQLGWFSSPTLARDNIAHEIGHNFGRRHAPCGGAANPDPAYPVSGGTTGAVGFDVYAWSSGSALQAAAQPATNGDIMGYCSPVWIGPYNYSAMMSFRGTVPSALRAASARPGSVHTTRAFVVRGRTSGGVIAFEPAFTTELLVEPDVNGTHRLELLDADGNVLRSQAFTPARVDHADDVRLFTVPVAVSAAEESALHAFRVVGPEGRFMRESSGAPRGAIRRVGSVVSASRVPGGTQWRLSCPDRETVGALVRDAETGDLLAIARGADVTVSTTAGRALTLLCSDGVLQAQWTAIAR